MDEVASNAEPKSIATSLEVEQLDKNLFRSKTLWLPKNARGVFGGQVISQAVVSATNCVDPEYHLHSLHSYFILSATPSIPVLYYVERLRDGRSYATRSVKAFQNGKLVFTMTCSFQKDEPGQPIHQRAMPPGVPSPDACKLVEDVLEERLADPRIPEYIKPWIKENAIERRMSPVAVKDTPIFRSQDGILNQAFWMKAKSIPKYELPFQRCILSYMSDLRLLGIAATELGLSRTRPWPRTLGMMSTLDHTVWFYSNDFDVGDWLLYVVNCVAAGNGRAVVFGQWFTQAGKLVAVCTQEGVVRIAPKTPEDGARKQIKSKL
ncbi:probable peroxisomal acyl-coenzyme A thioester hydrolase 1 [Serendipita indica DSM 11827]|uniref:Probable peroxisomal acyl-coenzyme A thioester hydrolase 1 n=1 Tax=Serendipita indica (strain DSM 11827) TaxID=1109443 RepID=G4TC00_SERID|nr:probable peroxisomal acyl-coenzyme A thioester hydrolase 1 [Serendipita indica DSM 11827]